MVGNGVDNRTTNGGPWFSAIDAVSSKLFSDQLSLIADANEIAKLGHVGD